MPTNKRDAASAAQVACVVGAGPAGILTAVNLARSGCFREVNVYERHPSPLVADVSDRHRAFVVMLHNRGRRALEEAGFDVAAFAPGHNDSCSPCAFNKVQTADCSSPEPTSKGSSSSNSSSLQWVDSIGVGSGAALEAWHTDFDAPRLVGSRHGFCCAMVAQAQAMGLPLHFHWNTSFEGVDLASKTALICSERSHGSSAPAGCCSRGAGNAACSAVKSPRAGVCQQRYDLLVAADGAHSRVRRAAEQQAPGLTSRVEPSPACHKVLTGLPPSPAFQPGRLRMLSCAGVGGLRHAAVMWLITHPATGATSGLLSLEKLGWQGLDTAADYECFLAQHFPALPADWRPEMAAQLARGQLAVSGMRVHASQLHAPSLLLVGDAGHGVTPRTGNGMNAALEDGWLVGQLLADSGGDLSLLPERFTEARLSDAQALIWLDGNATQRRGTSAWGRLHPAAVLSGASFAGRSLLGRATGGRVRPASLQLMNEACVPFGEVKAQIQRDRLLLCTLGAPLTAAYALLTAASAAATRLRG